MSDMNGWTHYRLGDVAPASSNELPAASATVWNLSLEDIESTTGRVLARSQCKVGELGSSKCSFDSRHVLYSKLRPYLNKVVLPDEPGVGTSELIPILPDRDLLDREYLAFYLRSPSFVGFANANTRGANLPRIAMSELWSHEVPAPISLSEQRRIVGRINECLSRVDEIENLREAQWDEAAQLPDALIDALIDEKWDNILLGEVASDVRNGWSGKDKQDADPVRVLKLSCVHNRHIDINESKAVRVPPAITTDFLIKRDDVFVVRGNGSPHLVGRSAISDQDEENVIFNDLLIRIRFRENMSPAFANVVFHSRMVREQILATAKTAAGIWKINQQHLAALKIPVPSIADQERLVELASTALAGARTLKNDIQQCESQKLREAILRKAFAGEL